MTVSLGSDVLAQKLQFGAATTYTAVPAGQRTRCSSRRRARRPGRRSRSPPAPFTVVVLDGTAGLKVDDLTDAVGSQLAPKGSGRC